MRVSSGSSHRDLWVICAMFEALISAVQSDSAGDALLYFCAFVLFSIFIVRYSTTDNSHVPLLFNPTQADSSPQSSIK
jgi:hypothetical protein